MEPGWKLGVRTRIMKEKVGSNSEDPIGKDPASYSISDSGVNFEL